MSIPQNTILSWSGGKDSSLALARLHGAPQYKLRGLFCSVSAENGRVSMHGVQRALLERQAAALNLDLRVAELPAFPSNAVYDAEMRGHLAAYRELGITQVAFGDIFLADVRAYREERMARVNMQAVFPLWGCRSSELIHEFIETGWRAYVVCVDTRVLGSEFLGREINARFVADLPDGIDPCGENGEFHSFVFDGPLFRQGLAVRTGAHRREFEHFLFCELHEAL